MIETQPSSPAARNGSAASAEPDPQETLEWIDALDGVIATEGPARARDLIDQLTARARTRGVDIPVHLTTPYINTIPADRQAPFPGDHDIEERLRHYVRWNAMAMVVRANKEAADLGGHVATFSSAATLVDVGFNHFWHAPSATHGGDLVYFQGHSSPGVYARAFLEGRIISLIGRHQPFRAAARQASASTDLGGVHGAVSLANHHHGTCWRDKWDGDGGNSKRHAVEQRAIPRAPVTGSRRCIRPRFL